jgi:hypothetical protein
MISKPRKPTLALVCPSPGLIGQNFGPEIDSCDVVVRVNSGIEIVSGREADLGYRTDEIYACGYMWLNLKTYDIPEGVQIRRKQLVYECLRFRDGNYVAYSNTGVLAALHYAFLGYEVRVFGMTFYAGEDLVVSDLVSPAAAEVDVVPREQVYIPGYNQRRFGDSHKLRHHGGLRDLAIMLTAIRRLDIRPCRVTGAVLERNRAQAELKYGVPSLELTKWARLYLNSFAFVIGDNPALLKSLKLCFNKVEVTNSEYEAYDIYKDLEPGSVVGVFSADRPVFGNVLEWAGADLREHVAVAVYGQSSRGDRDVAPEKTGKKPITIPMLKEHGFVCVKPTGRRPGLGTIATSLMANGLRKAIGPARSGIITIPV